MIASIFFAFIEVFVGTSGLLEEEPVNRREVTVKANVVANIALTVTWVGGGVPELSPGTRS